MMCINIYSLIERVCVAYPSYILSALPLILSYRWKNVIRFESIGYASNEGLSCRMSAMLRLVGTWCILMSPFCKWSWSHFIFRSTCLVLEFPGLMLFVHIAIVERLSSNMWTPCCGDPMLSNILMVWSTDLTQLTKLSSLASVVDRSIVRCSTKLASHTEYILFCNSGYAGVL